MNQSWITRFTEIVKKLAERFKSQSLLRKLLIAAASVAGIFIVFVLTLVLLVWTGALGTLPNGEELSAVENPLSTEIYSADSVLLGRYFIQERSNITRSELPEHLVDAIVSTEDVRFYEHGAIDNKSLVRVLVKSILLQKESAGGGSTLTQQLAKNLFPRKRYWMFSMPINKIREMMIASRLEDVYDKEAILTLYFNTVPFGDNTFGIEAAAQRFYSVHAKQLTADQSAVLVGMLKSTYNYNPRIFPEKARTRRNVVLEQMEKYGKLTAAETDQLKARPIQLSYNKITHHSGLAPYFREYMREELNAWCKTHLDSEGKPYNLYTDGLKIYTTIDSRMQSYAEEAVSDQMSRLQKTFDSHWGKREPWPKQSSLLSDAIRRSDRYKSLEAQGASHEEIMQVMKKPVLMTVFKNNEEQEVMMSPEDSIRHYLKFLQAGILAVDPHSGAVRVWVGGINHHYFQYDHVRESTKRQIGSTFKPIVYAAALEKGVSPCDFFSASKVEYTNMEGWTPENTENNYDLKYSLTGGLAYSVNTVSVRVLEQAGISNTIALARRMGISSELPSVPSIALGAANISMMEMVQAYACFANDGKATKPFYITAIADRNNNTLEAFTPPQSSQAMEGEHARLMIQMLRHTIDEGTGAGMRSRYGINNEMAGKTGTTQSNADGWFMSITPNLVVGAWVGADDPRIRFRSTALGQGARTALPIVATFYKQVNADNSLRNISTAHFPQPTSRQEDELSCDLFKSDTNVLQRIFGKKEKESKRAFGEKEKKKKGFFKRLFGS
jgi:penicillin-binding protein 1A